MSEDHVYDSLDSDDEQMSENIDGAMTHLTEGQISTPRAPSRALPNLFSVRNQREFLLLTSSEVSREKVPRGRALQIIIQQGRIHRILIRRRMTWRDIQKDIRTNFAGNANSIYHVLAPSGHGNGPFTCNGFKQSGKDLLTKFKSTSQIRRIYIILDSTCPMCQISNVNAHRTLSAVTNTLNAQTTPSSARNSQNVSRTTVHTITGENVYITPDVDSQDVLNAENSGLVDLTDEPTDSNATSIQTGVHNEEDESNVCDIIDTQGQTQQIDFQREISGTISQDYTSRDYLLSGLSGINDAATHAFMSSRRNVHNCLILPFPFRHVQAVASSMNRLLIVVIQQSLNDNRTRLLTQALYARLLHENCFIWVAGCGSRDHLSAQEIILGMQSPGIYFLMKVSAGALRQEIMCCLSGSSGIETDQINRLIDRAISAQGRINNEEEALSEWQHERLNQDLELAQMSNIAQPRERCVAIPATPAIVEEDAALPQPRCQVDPSSDEVVRNRRKTIFHGLVQESALDESNWVHVILYTKEGIIQKKYPSNLQIRMILYDMAHNSSMPLNLTIRMFGQPNAEPLNLNSLITAGSYIISDVENDVDETVLLPGHNRDVPPEIANEDTPRNLC